MKNRPIYENLDTSFVNLSALIKYLHRRQFTGYVRIELSGYEAVIYLTPENQLKVREYDHIAGRAVEGEVALQRILIRSREPDGIIGVYQTVTGNETVEKTEIAVEKEEITAAPPVEISANGSGSNVESESPQRKEKSHPPKTVFPNVPFEFTNRVEARAKQPGLSTQDREMLLNLMGELLGSVDRSLATAKLEFPAAFQKACAETSMDYPFLKTLEYGKGKIYYAGADTNPKFFVAGILEALRRILDKLAGNPKFAEVHRSSVQKILALIHQRRSFYDRFFITKPLEKILGV